MTRVLVAVDDTDTSLRAAETAHQLFGDDVEYLAVNVGQMPIGQADVTGGVVAPNTWGAVWPLRPVPYQVPESERRWSDLPTTREVAAQEAHRVAADAGLPDAQPLGEVGDPVEAITSAADRYDVDVVVVGHSDRNWFTRLFSTPTSTEVLKATTRPVLVVR